MTWVYTANFLTLNTASHVEIEVWLTGNRKSSH